MVHVTFQTKEFVRTLNALGALVRRKTMLPILENIRLEYLSQKKTFQLTASDSEAWLIMDVPTLRLYDGETDEAKKLNVCLPFSLIREAFAQLPDMILNAEIDIQKMTMRVDYSTGEFFIPISPAEDFPQPISVVQKGDAGSSVHPVCRFTLDAEMSEWLTGQMKEARVCVAHDELRPQMGCICLDCFHDHLVVVSSDGHSMFKNIKDTGMGWLEYGEFGATSSAKLLVPPSALDVIQNAFQLKEPITVCADTMRIQFSTETATLIFRTTDAKYPNYDSVIPQNQPINITLSKGTLRVALRRMSIFADESMNMFTLQRKGEQVILASDDPNYSRAAKEMVAIIDIFGDMEEGRLFAFKIATMRGLIDCIKTDNMVIGLEEPQKAAVIKEEDKDSALTLLIMPMVINQ